MPVKADTLDLVGLFDKDLRFRVPLFQRPYVWQQEKNWEPLWGDVKLVAERRLAAGETAARMPARPHFLGAVVLDQLAKDGWKITTREVIDGQQRLITLQLLLTAAMRVARVREVEDVANLLEPLVRNKPVLVKKSGADSEFKVWPTNADQAQFRSVMNEVPDEYGKAAQGLFVKALAYFTDAISEWLDGEDDSATRLGLLADVLRDDLRVVVIDLDEEDDAQVIFETLNSRGAALEAADLVKNRLFLRARGEGADLDALYDTYWKPFDSKAWRRNRAVGRVTRSRIDVFLSHWLTMKTGTETSLPNLFTTFDDWLCKTDLDGKAVFEELARYGQTYDDIENLPPTSFEGRVVYRIEQLQLTTVMPLLLYVYGLSDTLLEEQRRERLMAAVDSFLVRRFVCGLTTKDYNKLFSYLVGKVREAPAEADSVVIRELAAQTSAARIWPSDTEFGQTLSGTPLYLRIKGRVRIVLEGIEDGLRAGGKSEQPLLLMNDSQCKGPLTVEHIMPQKWLEHWPAPAGGAEGAAARDELLHTLGNLTLLNDKLNPDIGNAAWPLKKEKLAQHTVMRLTIGSVLHAPPTAVGNDWSGGWDESRIRARGRYLAARSLEVWPRLDAIVDRSAAQIAPDFDLVDEASLGSSSADRRAVLVRGAIELLAEHPLGLRRQEVGELLKERIAPLPGELEVTAAEGRDRYMLNIGWGTSTGPTQAEWMVKDGAGRWSITMAGREALDRYPDPAEFWAASKRAARAR